jgi:hypothetical protein
MNRGSVAVERAEEIKWWNALDLIKESSGYSDKLNPGIQLARECRHPDAQWLVSLLPAGVEVTSACLRNVLMGQTQDARALHLLFATGSAFGGLRRAAEMGYAPAQALLAKSVVPILVEDAFSFAEKASSQGHRDGHMLLGQCYLSGRGCAKDRLRAIALFKEAAELDQEVAQGFYGTLVYGELDWERYYWWGRASVKGHKLQLYVDAILQLLLPQFEKNACGRKLHTVAPVIRAHMNVAKCRVFEHYVAHATVIDLRRVLALHDAMMHRARQAIACWSMAGRRRGVVKDIRVIIAKKLWEEAWQWGESEPSSVQPF